MHNVFVIGVVLVFVRIWPVSDRIGAAHKGFIGYGIQNLFSVGRQGGVIVVLLVDLLQLGASNLGKDFFLCWGQLKRLGSCFLGTVCRDSTCLALAEWWSLISSTSMNL